MNKKNQWTGVVARVRTVFALPSLFALLLALCAPGGLHAEDKGEVIRIGGTGCALGGMKAAASAFRSRRPDISFRFLPSLGSSGGIQAVLAGAVDLGLSSRPLSGEERKQGAVALEYARTPIIFVTSHKGKTGDLTLERLTSIYEGKTKTWPDGEPLRLILRPAGDSDTAFLKSMSPAMDKAVQAALRREGLVTAITDQENADALGRIRGGFGAATLAQVLTEHRQLTPLRVNGTAPSLATLSDGSYPYYKTFYAVTGPHANPGVRAFIKFIESPAGRKVLRDAGHLAPGSRQ